MSDQSELLPRALLASISDESLMAELQRGHSGALADLFDRYHRLVFRIALRILRDHGEAEDLMQSVFLQLFRSRAQFDESKGTAKGWILRSAYHRSFNRKEYLILRGFYKDPEELVLSEESPEKESLRNSLDRAESKRALQEALGHLGATEREIVELSHYEGLTMREISQKTGRSFASVRHRYYRALETLRAVLYGRPDLDVKGAAKDCGIHV